MGNTINPRTDSNALVGSDITAQFQEDDAADSKASKSKAASKAVSKAATPKSATKTVSKSNNVSTFDLSTYADKIQDAVLKLADIVYHFEDLDADDPEDFDDDPLGALENARHILSQVIDKLYDYEDKRTALGSNLNLLQFVKEFDGLSQ